MCRYIGIGTHVRQLIAALVLLGIGLCFSTDLLAQEMVKPDVHLTFDVRPDGSNTTSVEIAVHPFLDPAIQRLLEWFEEQLPKGPGKPAVEIRATTREGRKYAALVAQFNSLGDLNAFINTPQLFEGLVGLIVPNARIPALFTEFRAWHDSNNSEAAYGLTASMTADTTAALAPLSFVIHLHLPYVVETHNADRVSGNELTWYVVPGEKLEISAIASAPSGLAKLLAMLSSAHPALLIGAGVVVLLVIAGGIVLVAYRRAARVPSTQDPY